jgi:hypothetical protein
METLHCNQIDDEMASRSAKKASGNTIRRNRCDTSIFHTSFIIKARLALIFNYVICCSDTSSSRFRATGRPSRSGCR